MNKICTFLLPFLLFGFCSCQQDDNENTTDFDDNIIATMGDNTGLKTTLYKSDSLYLNQWTKGDEFKLTDGEVLSTYSNINKNSLGSFARISGSRPCLPDGDTVSYFYYYPSEYCESYQGNGTFKVTLPDEQIYNIDGTVSVDAYPMMGFSKSLNFPFFNLASVFIVRLRSYPESSIVYSITLSADDNLSGSALAKVDTSDFKHPLLTMDPVDGTPKSVVLNCGEGVDVSNEFKEFFVVVPPGSHSNMNVSIKTDKGVRKSKFSNAISFVRSSYKSTSINLSLLSGGVIGEAGEDAE